MPGNRKITLKNIATATRDAAHPYSRKAHQLKRVFLREGKMERKRSDRESAVSRVVEKVLWFKNAVQENEAITSSKSSTIPAKTLTTDVIHNIIQLYISRQDEEIAQVKATIRPGRPSPPRLAILLAMREAECHEYATAGLEIPQMDNVEVLAVLRNFSGDFNSLGRIKMVRVIKPASSQSSS